MFFRRATSKKSFFRSLPFLEILEARLVPAGEFLLHSLPGATKRIFLDFDGHTTTGTNWNSSSQPTIVTPIYTIDGTNAFSAQENANIREIWERVTEDFLPFNVDVTTQDPGVEALRKTSTSDTEWGVRVCIGGNQFLGVPGVVGVALLNSFSSNLDDPAFAFAAEYNTANNSFNVKGIAETISHEVGHTLGLGHDGDPGNEYYPGHGTPQDGWAAIMGNSDVHIVTQWSKGEYSGANNKEDDLAIITNSTNGFGYRNDDYGNSISTAFALPIVSSTNISTTGIIERNTDLDFFKFNIASSGSVNINIDPAINGPNLNVEAKLYSSSGTVIATSSPTNALNANFSTTLQSGTYYISVDGVGNGNVATTGYSDYASLGYYLINGTIPAAASAPVITGPSGGAGATASAKTIPENTTAVHTFTANKSVTWSLAGGVDQGRFTINSTTGALSFVTPPDFENPGDSDKNNTYLVTVKALDSGSLSSTQTITVTVGDVTENPPVIFGPSGSPGASNSDANIPENTSFVFAFSADKPVTWSLAGGSDQSRFYINQTTGALNFQVAPDFESPNDSDRNNSYVVTLRATDSAGLVSYQTVTVHIGDVTENPPTNGTPRPDTYGALVIYTSANGNGNGAITGFNVKFNEPMNPSSFTSADITFLSPTGVSLAVNNPVVVPNTNNTAFTFTLAAGASAIGDYSLKIGPNISDLAGNLMNQDGDATNGEAVQDVYNAKFNILTSYTISNTKVVTIKDKSKIVSTITINQSLNIKDLNVLVNISHTADSDLIISLKSPTGQVCYLSNRRGAWGDNFTNTIFDDAALSAISSGAAPFNGTFRPDSLLSVFNDKNAKGVWTLTIEDKASGDVGKLNSWKLNILSNTKLSTTSNLANSDGGSVTSSINTALASKMALTSTPVTNTLSTTTQAATSNTVGQLSQQDQQRSSGTTSTVQSPASNSQASRIDALFSNSNPFSLFNL